MTDKLAFTIGLNLGEGNTAGQLSEVGKKLKAELEGLRAVASKIKLFEALQEDAKNAAKEFFATKKRVDDLKTALASVSDKGSIKNLTRDLKDAEKWFAAAQRALESKRNSLKEMRADLGATGAGLHNLAAAEKSLAAEINAANAALRAQANKDLLGIKTLADVQPQLARLQTAYRELATSGTLSMAELRQAKARLAAETRTLMGSTQSAAAGFTALRAEFVATVAGVYALQRGLGAAGSAWADFSQRMAEVDSITNMSRAQLSQMSAQVRELALRMGQDLNTAARALYDILGSGISEDNGIAVLAKSAKAAVAGVTDVNTAAKIGVAALNAYGLQASELEGVFDVLFKTVQNGVVTFPELAQSLGNVLPTARATGATLQEVGAAMAVLTKNGIKAPEAVTALNQAMNDLATPTEDALVQMRALDITYNGFIGTLQQISEKALTLDQLRAIVPDVRAAKGVLSLTQSMAGLNAQLAEMQNAAGATEFAYNKLKDTPQAKIDRFKSAVHELAVAFGEFALGAGGAVQKLTQLLNSFNSIDPAMKRTVFTVGTLALGAGAAALALAKLGPPLIGFASALDGAAGKVSLLSRALATLGAGVAGFKIGTWAYEKSEAVRRFGDVLGVTAGAMEGFYASLAKLAGAAFTFDSAGLERAAQQLMTNIALIRDEYIAVLSGAAERVNALTLRQQELAAAVAKTQEGMRKEAGAIGDAVQQFAAKVNGELTAVQTQISLLKGSLGSITQDLQSLANAALANGQATLAQIDAQTAAALALIERRRKAMDDTRLSETQAENALTKVYVDAARERMTALDKASKDTLAAMDVAEKARLQLAKTAGENLARVEQEIVAKRKEAYSQIVSSYRAMVDALNAEEQRHLTAAQTAANARRQMNEDFGEIIRRLNQAEMTEAQKRSSDLQEADRLLYKAREALRAGDDKLAREYATKAVSLAQQTAKEITEGENVIVTGREAARAAVQRVTAAQNILNESLTKEEQTHKSAAASIATARVEAEKYLSTFTKGLDELIKRASNAVKVQIEADTKVFERDITALRAALAKEAALLPLKLKMDEAQTALDNIKRAIETGATLTIQSNLPTIKQNLDEVSKAFPALADSLRSATSATDTLAGSATKLGTLNTQLQQVSKELATAQGRVNDLAKSDTSSQHTVKDNVPAVLQEIAKLKAPTESTHTIKIKRVEEGGGGTSAPASGGDTGGGGTGLASGGYIPRFARSGSIMPASRDISFAARAYAAGGPVFRRALAGRVPGLGTGDTVAAMLRPGSFVLRHAAVQHYGAAPLARLARRYATGGAVGREFFNNYPSWGTPRELYKEAQTSATYDLQFGPPTLPSDENERNSAIYGFAQRALNSHAGQQGQWQTFGDSLAGQVKDALQYIARTADTSAYMSRVLAPARTITLNLRAGPDIDADLIGYDIDGRGWHRGPAGENGEKTWEFFAAGGHAQGRDRVPAMLTPGEYVMSPSAVSHFGPGFMAALNAKAIPKGALAAAVRHFADGGIVANTTMYRNLSSQINAQSSGGGVQAAYRDLSGATSGNTVNVTINVDGKDLLSEDQIRRKIVPAISDIMRRAR